MYIYISVYIHIYIYIYIYIHMHNLDGFMAVHKIVWKGGMIRSETLIELKCRNSSCSSLPPCWTQTNSFLSSNSRQQFLSQQYPPPPLSISIPIASATTFMTVFVNITLLLCEPLICNPAAETPTLPLLWCCGNISSEGCSSPQKLGQPWEQTNVSIDVIVIIIDNIMLFN